MRRARSTTLWAVAVTAASSLACLGEREPGPLEREHGKVLFWEVDSLAVDNEGCSDAPDLQQALAAPTLEEGTFFIYEVDDDGSQATAQDCTETRAESCSPVPEVVFDIDGHLHTYAPEPELVTETPDCDILGRQVWLFEDLGEVGTLDIAIDFPFEGLVSACEQLDDDLASEGTNDLGLASCEVTLSAELSFFRAD